ncbi:MAG TPA: protein-glutamate O-methyltransferase CheR, partial [Candidatus Bathyarchaeota archaeon]|nr:protein-glutamate O-methyltransferase CheR [Candidatus Bathyarchaeota archaeon]
MYLRYKSQKVNIEEQGFNVLKKLIYKQLGLNCTYYRDSYLRRRVDYRMRLKGISSYWEY